MIARRLLLTLPAILAARCSSPPPPPAVLTLAVIGGPDQNPDPAGQPTPVAVRLFQLKSTAAFDRADVFALTEREQQTLGPDGQGSEEFVVRPGETRMITRELKPGVQFIGTAVLFRNIDGARWRGVAPVAASGPSRHSLMIRGTTAALA
ncbi:MAG: type VI secretion system lipoprotein TssJ [Alphaproteobacteria bacterium]|nr:type VI secretion system lipoprotein TssJ [Alphaproteobacteria bacterium]